MLRFLPSGLIRCEGLNQDLKHRGRTSPTSAATVRRFDPGLSITNPSFLAEERNHIHMKSPRETGRLLGGLGRILNSRGEIIAWEWVEA